MKTKKNAHQVLRLMGALLAMLLTSCGDDVRSNAGVTAPTITSTDPYDGAISVATNSKVVSYFSDSTDSATIEMIDSSSFTVTGENEAAVIGTVQKDYSSKSVSFKPSNPFSKGKLYTAKINTVLNGVSNDYIWRFTSSGQEDLTPSEVIATYPVDGDTVVPVNGSISALFNESLDPSTINFNSFIVTTDDNTLVDGTVSYEKKLASFKPSSNLSNNTIYKATLTTVNADLADNALISNVIWTFTAGTSLSKGPEPVNLRTARDFVILTKTGISKTGSADTLIKGDIGVSPAPRTYITGFSDTLHANTTYATSIYVEGKIYSADMTPPTPAKMTAAISDMETAYTDAAGRKIPDFTELHAGKIGGKTLSPGLYKWGTNVWIDSDVTLVGGKNDVWIFQVSGDVIQASATKVILTGGALAKNVFWQIAGGMGLSLDTTAHFEGVVLTHKAIIVKTGATVNGRLLSQTASTLDANKITEPVK
jgi:hypothetical protein